MPWGQKFAALEQVDSEYEHLVPCENRRPMPNGTSLESGWIKYMRVSYVLWVVHDEGEV